MSSTGELIYQAVETNGALTVALDTSTFSGHAVVVVVAADENENTVSVTASGVELGAVAAGSAQSFAASGGGWVAVGGGAASFAGSRLMATPDATTDDMDSDADAVMAWFSVETVGDDLEIDGLDATKINVLTSGVYAVSLNLQLVVLSGTAFTDITPELNIDPSDMLGNWYVEPILDAAAVLTKWGTNLTLTYAMAAGTTIGADVVASVGGAGHWRVSRPVTRILVQRLG